eukprot:gene12504-26329_t
MIIQLYLISLICFKLVLAFPTRIIVLNIIGSQLEDFTLSIANGLHFISETSKLDPQIFDGTLCHIYTRRGNFNNLNENTKLQLSKHPHCELFFYSNMSLPDNNMAYYRKKEEQVTPILESLSMTLSLSPPRVPESITKAVFITVSNSTKITPTKEFLNIFTRIDSTATISSSSSSFSSGSNAHIYHIMLLGKTRRMTSVSDWRDLGVIAMCLNDVTRQWLSVLRTTYFHHASNRPAFTLLDPRPAILEANTQLRGVVRVGHFRRGEVCAVKAKKREGEGGGTTHCKAGRVLLEVGCSGGDVGHNHNCVSVDENQNWKHTFDRGIDSLEFKLRKDKSLWTSPELLDAAEHGVLRFVMGREMGQGQGQGSGGPAPFCWETNSTTDYPIASRSISQSSPYSDDVRMSWLGQQSGPPYTIKGGVGPNGIKGTISKVLMTIDLLLRFPDHEWIVWFDDDTWINP